MTAKSMHPKTKNIRSFWLCVFACECLCSFIKKKKKKVLGVQWCGHLSPF